MTVFLLIINVGIKINADVNVKNELIKVFVKKDLFGILAIMSMNGINHVILLSV